MKVAVFLSSFGILLLQGFVSCEANEVQKRGTFSVTEMSHPLQSSPSQAKGNSSPEDTCEDPKMLEELSNEDKGRDISHKAFDIWKYCARKFGYENRHAMELAVKAIRKLKGVNSVMLSPDYRSIFLSTSPPSASSSISLNNPNPAPGEAMN